MPPWSFEPRVLIALGRWRTLASFLASIWRWLSSLFSRANAASSFLSFVLSIAASNAASAAAYASACFSSHFSRPSPPTSLLGLWTFVAMIACFITLIVTIIMGGMNTGGVFSRSYAWLRGRPPLKSNSRLAVESLWSIERMLLETKETKDQPNWVKERPGTQLPLLMKEEPLRQPW